MHSYNMHNHIQNCDKRQKKSSSYLFFLEFRDYFLNLCGTVFFNSSLESLDVSMSHYCCFIENK